MLAHEFIRSEVARDSDFTTHPIEQQYLTKHDFDHQQHAIVAQFASADPVEFARAAALIQPWVDGVDLNCGCPQSWALKSGIGCSLMNDPDLVAKMIEAAKTVMEPGKTVSCKIRIHKDLRKVLLFGFVS